MEKSTLVMYAGVDDRPVTVSVTVTLSMISRVSACVISVADLFARKVIDCTWLVSDSYRPTTKAATLRANSGSS
jgi:hypothetical protein